LTTSPLRPTSRCSRRRARRFRQLRVAPGIEVGSVTLHPSGIPHGPHLGLAEKSIGQIETHELAVMCDTFHPLRLTKLAKKLDDGQYAYSWLEERVPAAESADEDPAGVTSHF
jgi:hypothetical protein